MNILVGVLQSLVPAAVAYVVGAGWINASDLSGIASILVAIGTTVSSAVTTTAVKK